MEELTALRTHIEQQNYAAALSLVDELEEMSEEDKLNKIYSYSVILLVHLIKQQAESRTTTSWDLSIRNSVRAIKRVNKRRKSGGYYASHGELSEIVDEAFDEALDNACVEIFEGKYDKNYLLNTINPETIKAEAISYST
ncbi:MAG: DUF29 family protein [Tunicatimonas sp.]